MIGPLMITHNAGASRLITDPREPTVYSTIQTHDERSAVTQGLADYLGQLSITSAGSDIRLVHVTSELEEPEQLAKYPSACVYADSDGDFDDENSSGPLGGGQRETDKLNSREFFRIPCEFIITLSVDLWCTDRAERRAITAMATRAMYPVEWMYGFRLELPYYFNARARYTLISSNYGDNATNAIRRYRLSTMRVQAQVSVIIPTGQIPIAGRSRLTIVAS